MRKLARRVLVAAITIPAIGALSLVGTRDANASTGNQVVVSTASSGACNLQLLASWDGHGNDYAAARITGTSPYFDCNGVLQRSTDGGRTWTDVSSVHSVIDGQSVTTYNYWDGAGYLCRVYGVDFTDFPPAVLWTGSW